MGFSIRWRWLVLCRLRRCSGETRCRTGRVPCCLGVGLRPIREYEGEIFTDYYFDEANTANKSDKYHSNAINENLNWGGISGLLHRGMSKFVLNIFKGFLLFFSPLKCIFLQGIE